MLEAGANAFALLSRVISACKFAAWFSLFCKSKFKGVLRFPKMHFDIQGKTTFARSGTFLFVSLEGSFPLFKAIVDSL